MWRREGSFGWLAQQVSSRGRHHGVEDNLSWESLPSIYDLKAIWATYLGIPSLHAATTGVMLIGCALIAFGLFRYRGEHTPFRRLFVTTLVFTAFVPPCFLFLLSLKPFALPLFGARHLLPSIVSYLLLVADGLVQVSAAFPIRKVALVTGSAGLLALELVPTAAAMTAGPRRVPFQAILNDTSSGLPEYTTWPYGIGSTMNFYAAGRVVVRDVPRDRQRLPDGFLLIFRPVIPREEQQFEDLLHKGWKDVGDRDFYNGLHTGYYVRVADLQRVRLN